MLTTGGSGYNSYNFSVNLKLFQKSVLKVNKKPNQSSKQKAPGKWVNLSGRLV